MKKIIKLIKEGWMGVFQDLVLVLVSINLTRSIVSHYTYLIVLNSILLVVLLVMRALSAHLDREIINIYKASTALYEVTFDKLLKKTKENNEI